MTKVPLYLLTFSLFLFWYSLGTATADDGSAGIRAQKSNEELSGECTSIESHHFDEKGMRKAIRNILFDVNSLDFKEKYEKVWSTYTFRDSDTLGNPLVGVLLGYQAIRGGMPLRALTNLELAHYQVNKDNYCEGRAIHFLLYAGRVNAVDLLDNGSDEFRIFSNLTTGVNHPFEAITERDLSRMICAISKSPHGNYLVGLKERFLYLC